MVPGINKLTPCAFIRFSRDRHAEGALRVEGPALAAPLEADGPCHGPISKALQRAVPSAKTAIPGWARPGPDIGRHEGREGCGARRFQAQAEGSAAFLFGGVKDTALQSKVGKVCRSSLCPFSLLQVVLRLKEKGIHRGLSATAA